MTETAWQRRIRREAARAAYVAEHGNRCELCGNEPKSRGLSEDHDHKTGAHRGWLCFRCNRALPAYVTLEWLRKAVAYLERGSASAAADEPAHKPEAGLAEDDWTPYHEFRANTDPPPWGRGKDDEDVEPLASAAADEPGETPA